MADFETVTIEDCPAKWLLHTMTLQTGSGEPKVDALIQAAIEERGETIIGQAVLAANPKPLKIKKLFRSWLSRLPG